MHDDWNKMSDDQRHSVLNSMSAEQQTQFATDMGWFGHATGLSAPPEAGSIPWMKEKAYSILDWGARQLPMVGGAVGGIVGGVAGAAINPAGGEVPGAITGSGIGGAVGDAGRQAIEHLQGYDQFEDPETKTAGHRFLGMAKEGAGQAAAEATGQLLGKMLRPTLKRSLAKLYYSGGIKYGNPLGRGDLDTVIEDLIKTEKSGVGKATTVGDFLGVIKQLKNDIGQQVDLQLALPINQNGKMIMLGKAHADSRPIVNAITAMATADPSIVKEATLNKAGKEAVYLEHIKKEALKFSQQPWTYEELTSKRIRLNNELSALYDLPKGEQRAYLLDHPDLAVAKAEADAIRDVIYPVMDSLSGRYKGATAELQGKRGALMSIENQVTDHLGVIKTKARQAQGAPMTEKANISSYGTTGGRPGLAVHRLSSLVHTPNPERSADKQVAKAFGNTAGTKVRKAITSPAGSDRLGDELLSMPLRELVLPSKREKIKDQEVVEPDPVRGVQGVTLPVTVKPNGGQSSVSTPKELIQKAKALNPSGQGQVAYTHTAVNPATGHKIGSHDGQTWFDVSTGQKVA